MKIKYLLLPALILLTAGCVQTKQADYTKPLQDLASSVNQLNESVSGLTKRIETLESEKSIYTTNNVPTGWNVFRNDQYKISLAYPQNWSANSLQTDNSLSKTPLLQVSPQSNRADIAPNFKNYIVDVSVVNNKDNLTPQGLYDREYNECLKVPDNDFGCPHTSGKWNETTIGSYKAFRAELSGAPVSSNVTYVQKPGYYVVIQGTNYLEPYDPKDGSDLDKIFESILDTVIVD